MIPLRHYAKWAKHKISSCEIGTPTQLSKGTGGFSALGTYANQPACLLYLCLKCKITSRSRRLRPGEGPSENFANGWIGCNSTENNNGCHILLFPKKSKHQKRELREKEKIEEEA